jgi:predicted dinucleotide-binding enzyme
MNIAIIGTGNVGSALGRSLSRAGHRVTLAGRDSQKTRRVAQEIGVRAADGAREAAAGADVVILAVWYSDLEAVARELGDAVSGKVVVEPSNPLTADFSGLATAGGPSAAEQLRDWLPNARVVKAFNTLFGSLQADPGAHGQRVDALFATDDEEARLRMFDVLDSLGFRPVDVGPLVRARELESLAFLNIGLQLRYGGDWRTASVFVGAPEAATRPTAAAAA